MAQLPFILPRLLLALSLACCGGCWHSGSPATRFQVASSSMAPTLLGPTLLASCSNCKYAFPIAAETYRPRLPTRCPNCGGLCQIDPAIHPGQTVLMEPVADSRDVRRWDLIAFQEAASHTIQVKRVWALPGEAIELRQGGAWIDGSRLRKSLAELRQVAVPVYELDRGGACQWRYAEGKGRGEQAALDAIERPHANRPLATDAVSSVMHLRGGQPYYLQHVRPAPVHPHDVPVEQWLQAGPVTDVYSMNQGLSTALHTVTAGLISLQLQRPLGGPLRIDLRAGERTISVLLHPPEPAPAKEPSRATAPAADLPATPALTTADFRIAARQHIELGWCDGRLLMETDVQSREVEADELDKLPVDMQDPQPDQLGWASSDVCRLESTRAVEISQFRFARDLYLTAASSQPTEHRGSAEQKVLVAEQLSGYYVLGDNVAASRDSRYELGRVQPAQVLGRIVADQAR